MWYGATGQQFTPRLVDCNYFDIYAAWQRTLSHPLDLRSCQARNVGILTSPVFQQSVLLTKITLCRHDPSLPFAKRADCLPSCAWRTCVFCLFLRKNTSDLTNSTQHLDSQGQATTAKFNNSKSTPEAGPTTCRCDCAYLQPCRLARGKTLDRPKIGIPLMQLARDSHQRLAESRQKIAKLEFFPAFGLIIKANVCLFQPSP